MTASRSEDRTATPRLAFAGRFGREPAGVVRAPGRVNLIGEHTDYNDGFVLPAAIDLETHIAFSPRRDGVVDAFSESTGSSAAFPLDDFNRRVDGWGRYVQGVAWVLARTKAPTGWDGVILSTVPPGAGLSSSASLELAVARAFAVSGDLEWEPAAMARLAREAEHEWVGVRCGIMDQLASACGRAGHAMLVDCRSLDISYVSIPPGFRIVIVDTGTRRSLDASAYNERRSACARAARAAGADALRDVEPDDLPALRRSLDDATFRAARHVVTENARTLAAARSLAEGDVAAVGAFMRESHASLRDDFRVSSPALDAAASAARAAPGCAGARMTGAGFAGCVVALVAADAVVDFARAVERSCRSSGLDARVLVCRSVDGAGDLA